MKLLVAKGVTVVLLVAALAFPLASPAFAASLGTQGQPNQTCGQGGANRFPGNADSAPGSPFNEGVGTAGSVYAGTGPSADHANSPHAVSQYDVACSK